VISSPSGTIMRLLPMTLILPTVADGSSPGQVI